MLARDGRASRHIRKSEPRTPSQWVHTGSSPSLRKWLVIPFSRCSCAGRQPCLRCIQQTLISYLQLRVITSGGADFQPVYLLSPGSTSRRFRPDSESVVDLVPVPHQCHSQLLIFTRKACQSKARHCLRILRGRIGLQLSPRWRPIPLHRCLQQEKGAPGLARTSGGRTSGAA